MATSPFGGAASKSHCLYKAVPNGGGAKSSSKTGVMGVSVQKTVAFKLDKECQTSLESTPTRQSFRTPLASETSTEDEYRLIS